MKYQLGTAVLALSVMVSPALAHTGAGATAGLPAGVLHPLAGLDHVLAMAAIGIWAVTLGKRAIWAVPAAFVVMMAGGAVLAAQAISLPFIEAGIAFSVITLGALLAFGIRVPVAAGMVVAGLFALFHGHAHGAEIPVGISGLAYGLGFCVATVSLHAAGALIGWSIRPSILRWMGVAVSAAGLGLLAVG